MSGFVKKEVLQAILIADCDADNFRPLSDENSTALMPLVNVALLDYALEALNRNGVEEVFLYSSLHLNNVREHIKSSVAAMCSWSVSMEVHVIGGEGSRCFGDAMRDLDAKALIRGHFIIMGVDTVTNADLRTIFDEHKKTANYDKGAAATLVFKEVESSARLRTGNELMIAMDALNNRLHHHQRLRINCKEMRFDVPLEVFINNSRVTLMQNLLDPQIAIGSPSMLSLFSDNFDFQTRDDFVRGLLINEEILDSRIYVSLLPRNRYARKVNNWLSYQLASRDIIDRWAYPLVPDMGIHCLEQQYICMRNNVYKNRTASAAKVSLHENCVVQANCHVDAGALITHSVLGVGCRVAANCRLTHAFCMAGVSVGAGCVLEYCVIGEGAVVGAGAVLQEGTIVGAHCVIPAGVRLAQVVIKSSRAGANADDYEDEVISQLSDKAFIIVDNRQSQQAHTLSVGTASETLDSDEEDDDDADRRADKLLMAAPAMRKLPVKCEPSDYEASSSDDDDDEDGEGGSRRMSLLPDDSNIFLSEVMDSLARGYQEKSNPDFLILEINSSRYAYNMSLKEVNFFVVKALLSLPPIAEPPAGNVLVGLNCVLKQLGAILTNYIKTPDAMLECLKAIGEVCEENEYVRQKISPVIHLLYDKDFVSEDAIVAWYEQLDAEEQPELRRNLKKLIEWLNQSSEEEEDDDDEDADKSD